MVDHPNPTETLTGKQFQKLRLELGASIPEITRVLNITSARTVRRWEDEEVPVSGPATVLMQILHAVPGAYAFAAKKAHDRAK